MKAAITFPFLLFALFQMTIGHAQRPEQQLNLKVAELREQGVDTLIKFTPYCVGNFRNSEPGKCLPYDIYYLFWKVKNVAYAQRFDECRIFQPKQTKTDSLFIVLRNNLTAIDTETMKKVQFDTHSSKGVASVIIDHTCFSDFTIYAGNKTITKSVSDFSMDTQFVEDVFSGVITEGFESGVKRLNFNFAHNQHTIINTLRQLARQEVAILYH